MPLTGQAETQIVSTSTVFEFQVEVIGRQLGEVEDVVDQVEQVLATLPDIYCGPILALVEHAECLQLERFRKPEDAGERRT